MVDPILSKVYNQEMSSSAPIKLAAVIVDGRNLPEVCIAIEDHMRFLPEGTHLRWHTRMVPPLATHSSVTERYRGTVAYHTQLDSIADYNRILTSPAFWESLLAYDRVLIFQEDSRLLRTGIEEFYEWDYCGAPWRFQQHGANGGLSLRDPKVMKEICEKYPWDGYSNEDIYFCNTMYHHGVGNLAPRDACRKFSCEVIEEYGTLGTHAIDKYHSPEVCERIKNQYKKQEA